MTTRGWKDVCALEAIVADTGVCALIGGRQVAVFRLRDGALHAVDNIDPFTGAAVLSRGIVGDRGGVPKVASPLHKQSFDLRTGACLDEETVRVTVFPVRVRDGRVQIAAPHDAVGAVPPAATSSR